MKILTTPQYASGFFYQNPVEKIHAITHCAENIFICGHRRPPHTHPGFEFIYLSRGSATRYVGAPRICQRMGDLYITYPRERHRVECEPSEEGRQIQIGLQLEELGPPGSHLADYLRRERPRLLHDCHAIEPILQAIIWQVVTSLPKREATILAFLHALCALIHQSAMRDEARNPSETKIALPYAYPIQKALFYMKKHLDRRLPLPELASVAGASHVGRFCTQFHEEVKMTPSAYHLQMRLDAARNALQQSSWDITSIALEHGFSSSQHFCMAFRRVFDTSPRAWRKLGR
jgi:AraC-like DNA-binding protein